VALPNRRNQHTGAPLPPDCAAYLAAFDAWLAAGRDRNDTEASRLLDEMADRIHEQLPPRPQTIGNAVPKLNDHPMRDLLQILR